MWFQVQSSGGYSYQRTIMNYRFGVWLFIANETVKTQHFPNVNLLGKMTRKQWKRQVERKKICPRREQGRSKIVTQWQGCTANKVDGIIHLVKWGHFITSRRRINSERLLWFFRLLFILKPMEQRFPNSLKLVIWAARGACQLLVFQGVTDNISVKCAQRSPMNLF